MNPKEFRRSLRKNHTGAEARLWSVLRNRKLEGRKFRRQHSIGKYTVDFLCFEEKLVVEVDGSSHDNVSKVLYDEKRDIIITAQGHRIIRFTNKEVYNHIEEVLNEIKYNFNSTPTLTLSWEEREYNGENKTRYILSPGRDVRRTERELEINNEKNTRKHISRR